jgi:hypothetical protein
MTFQKMRLSSLALANPKRSFLRLSRTLTLLVSGKVREAPSITQIVTAKASILGTKKMKTENSLQLFLA